MECDAHNHQPPSADDCEETRAQANLTAIEKIKLKETQASEQTSTTGIKCPYQKGKKAEMAAPLLKRKEGAFLFQRVQSRVIMHTTTRGRFGLIHVWKKKSPD